MPSPVKQKNTPDLTGRRRPGWDLEMSVDILEDIAEGKSLKASTSPRVPGRVAASTFLYWCMKVPELQEAYRVARELSGHMLEDEALEMARKLPTLSGPAPEMSARIRGYDVAIGHLRWAAGKRHPKEYGDKAQTTFAVPIQINTTIPLELGEGGQLPGVEAREAFVIEVTPEPPPPPPSTDIYEAKARELPPKRPGFPKGRQNLKVAEARRKEFREGRRLRYQDGKWVKGPLPPGPLPSAKEDGDAEAARTVCGDTLDGRQERDGVDGVSQPPVEEAGPQPHHDPGVGGEGDASLPDPGPQRE